MAVTFQVWAEHYGYDPDSEAAWSDYLLYQSEAVIAESLFGGFMRSTDTDTEAAETNERGQK